MKELASRGYRIRLNPLVMGLCFYLLRVYGSTRRIGLNPLVMGLCFYRLFWRNTKPFRVLIP